MAESSSREMEIRSERAAVYDDITINIKQKL
jgi:hypothetical protein